MLTVKQINMIGEEVIYATTSVRYSPKEAQEHAQQHSPKSGGPMPAPRAFLKFVTHPEGIESMFDGGTVFVMNEHGKTISRYDLGASPTPLNPTVNGLTATQAIRESA